jgi:hypothetical protein
MRLLSVAILVLGLPAGAAAQSSVSALASLPPLPPIGLPLPSITSPLAPIGFPLSSIGVAPQIGTPPRGGWPSRGRDGDHRRFDPRNRFRSQPTFVYMFPMYGWGIQPPVVATSIVTTPYPYLAPAPDERPVGILRLELQAAGAAMQLYVDGYFVGTPDEINRDLTLEAGPHRIEIRASGYETITFDVRIVAGRSITYRATLQRVASQPQPQPSIDPPAGPAQPASQLAPAAPSTFYFIPGCYIGNVPPEKVELPANCDMSLLITRKP